MVLSYNGTNATEDTPTTVMPTTRKHIAVYLTTNNEADLKRYCRENELKNSAAINEILSLFFNPPQESDLPEPIVNEEIADLVAQQLEQSLEKTILARIESRLGELIRLQLNSNLPTLLVGSQEIKGIIERLSSLETLVNNKGAMSDGGEGKTTDNIVEQKPKKTSPTTTKRGRKAKPTASPKPTAEDIMKMIRKLDEEFNTDAYLPIFYLRKAVGKSLNREELDEILYELEHADQITLSTLEELTAYDEDWIEAGIPQASGHPLFFIMINPPKSGL